jgi:LuxR family maltose regulon positive regulatory protein
MPGKTRVTKLYRLPVRARLVSRTRLIDRLNIALQKRLTLLSAPPGFGKTTLLSQWISRRLVAFFQT